MPPAAPLARLILATTLISSHLALAATPEFALSTGRNALRFNDAHPAADFVGMGFVLEHAGRHYAVTADSDGVPRFAPARLDYLRSVLAELPVAVAGS